MDDKLKVRMDKVRQKMDATYSAMTPLNRAFHKTEAQKGDTKFESLNYQQAETQKSRNEMDFFAKACCLPPFSQAEHEEMESEWITEMAKASVDGLPDKN